MSRKIVSATSSAFICNASVHVIPDLVSCNLTVLISMLEQYLQCHGDLDILFAVSDSGTDSGPSVSPPSCIVAPGRIRLSPVLLLDNEPEGSSCHVQLGQWVSMVFI